MNNLLKVKAPNSSKSQGYVFSFDKISDGYNESEEEHTDVTLKVFYD